MKKLLYIMLLAPMMFVACDVHELPEAPFERVPFSLHLDFNTELPLYKEVIHSRSGEAEIKETQEKNDIRYTIKAYRTEDGTRNESRVADATFVFSKSDITDLNYTANIELYEGTYLFQVWADYVDEGSKKDKYYNTTDFSEIELTDKDNHIGSNDYKDAFRGYATAKVVNPKNMTGVAARAIDNQVTVDMMRPLGKFKFVSTDVDVFINRVVTMMKEKGNQNFGNDYEPGSKEALEQFIKEVNLKDFKVIFRYNIFMPCSFNMFTDKPAFSWTGMSFLSDMYTEDYKEMTLGYDYIFVNGSVTTLSILVEVYNDKDELIASTNPIDVPIVRSKLTLVKGRFLSSIAKGGVNINPGYEGDDYNVEIF